MLAAHENSDSHTLINLNDTQPCCHMSELLSQSFSNLKVMSSRLCWLISTDVLKKVIAPPKIQITLPSRPADGRACFYGYDVAMQWLVDYSTTHWRRVPTGDRYYDDLSKASGGIQLLRRHSGIKRLELEFAIKDQAAPSDTVTIPGYQPGEVRVPVISIFSDEGPSFKRRPSQEQVDRLSEILGKQPRWWVDYEDPRTYGY